MTGSMDDAPSGSPRSHRGPLDGINPPEDHPLTKHQPSDPSVDPPPRSDHVGYSESPSRGYAPAPAFMAMGDIRSTLPGYHPHVPFNQPMQQPFYPNAQPPGILYPMHPFYGASPGGGTAYNFYSQMYQSYVQQQHQHTLHGPGYPYMHHSSPQPTTYTHTYYTQQHYPTAHGPAYPPGPRQQTQFSTVVTRKEDQPAASKTIVDGSKSATVQFQVLDGTSSPSTPSGPLTPRGPPRKPKQSGHALWVGNLPPGTNVFELKDYFARDATADLESVFLISKSNCAFINYKTEASCTAALARFNDSKFKGVRLVCRLRRGLLGPNPSISSPAQEESPGIEEQSLETKVADDRPSRVPNRYFVVKSLTFEDLELSRQSGIWATQNHNEANFNQAFETADNVYLIFSANKSGEYYGYARMVSPIIKDEALALEMPPRPEHVVMEDLNVVQTQATSTAPSGRIIDDAVRGTIFWEADSSEDEAQNEKSEKSVGEVVEETPESGSQSIGNPFRIQWLSTDRVPFHRTRGLRNAWNANREVKIARDGTEIEPSAGAKLLQLFHPPPSGTHTPSGYENTAFQ